MGKEIRKIGILSCYTWLLKTGNYGTLLQNFALQKAINSLGHETIWVALAPKRRSMSDKLWYFLLRPHRLIYGVYTVLISFWHRNNRQQLNKVNFDNFLNKNVPCTPYLPLAELAKQEYYKELTHWIVGSDNVWTNPGDNYFLGFIPDSVPKISYAASAPWGHLCKHWAQKASFSLKRFKAISVREEKGIQYVREAGCHATHVLDPTLLLTKENYITYLSLSKHVSSKYIFGYFVNPQSEQNLRLNDLFNYGKKVNLPVLISAIQGAEQSIPPSNLLSLTPEEWLSHIMFAECVVTNSFHGMAFSIIFEKNFVIIPQKGETARGNSRFESLLKKLGLTDRICYDSENISHVINKPIDWQTCNSKLNELREQSFAFLKSAID